MGNMAATVVKGSRQPAGVNEEVLVDFVFSNSYATNGDTIIAADILQILPRHNDLTVIDHCVFEVGSLGHTAFLDKTNKKVKAFNGTTEIGNGTNLSAVTLRARIRLGNVDKV